MRSLDEVLGLKKTEGKHNFKIDDRVVTNENQFAFKSGHEATIIGFDQWNRLIVNLDELLRLKVALHHSHVDKL